MISPALASRSQLNLPVRARLRRGLSVVELLAATVISLIVMGATVQLFGTVGNQISNGRSNIELGDRLRTAVERLRKDLRGHTADTLVWNRPEDASGYFEIIKGPPNYWDQNAWKQWQSPPVSTFSSTSTAVNSSAITTPGATLQGYTKDMLFFTTRSRDQPFVGRAVSASGQNMTVESQVAEVCWFLYPTSLVPPPANPVPTNPPTYTLYRRQMLVLPGVGSQVATGTPPSIPAVATPSKPQGYYDSYSGSTSIPSGTVPLCDISAHPDGTNSWPNVNMILNSLADLSYRENRYAHFFTPASGSSNSYGNTAFGSGAPFPVLPSQVSPFPQNPAADPNLRYGEDVVLSNVLSFDVKVWDPWAQVKQDAKGNPMVPSDPGYSAGGPIGASGVYGAYVDLNWNSGAAVTNPGNQPSPYFAQGFYGLGQNSYLTPNLPQATSASLPAPGSATYDTWSAGYETWLYNPTGNKPQTSNQSNNGLQDPLAGSSNAADGGVDGPLERLTCPPYPVPLRGVQIKIRTYEFTSKQVREVTLQESFVPD